VKRLFNIILAVLLAADISFAQVSVFTSQKAKPTGAQPAADAVTGVGFLPLLVFYSTGPNGGTANGNVAHAALSFGIGVSATDRLSVGWSAQDNVATTNTGRSWRGEKNLVSHDATGAAGSAVAVADVTSMDADGFTLSWTINNATASLYNYMALGGAGVTAANVTFQNWDSASGGNKTFAHGLGTTPSIVFIFWGNASAGSGQGSTLLTCLGVGTANGDQWVIGQLGIDATAVAADMDAASIGLTDKIAVRLATGPAIGNTASLVSMDATNVTLNQDAAWNSANDFEMIAIAGGVWKIGSTAKTTGAEPAADTIASSLGFEPKGMILMTHGKAASASPVTDAIWSVGFASETAENHVTASYKDATLNTQADSRLSNTRALSIITAGTPTLEAELDISLDANGVTGTWTDNHATASQILWIAVGQVSTAIVPIIREQNYRRRL
jgi:hypothetical protein